MSLDRTPPIPRDNANGENSNTNQATNAHATVPDGTLICHCCNGAMTEGQECLSLSQCWHSFHRNCIEGHLSTTAECPTCRIPCQLSDLRLIAIGSKPRTKTAPKGKGRGAMAKQYNTRHAAKNLFQGQSNLLDFSEDSRGAEGMTPSRNERVTDSFQENNRSIPPPNVAPSVDYREIQRMIETSLSTMITRLNILPNNNTTGPNRCNQDFVSNNASSSLNANRRNSPEVRQQPQPQPRIDNQFPNSPNRFSVSSIPLQPDKITTIIQNWQLKFDGSPAGLTVDEFLYRVTTLTEDNFNGDFALICRNLNILLSGKAREWYWRYRKNVDQIVWEEFCDSIKFQYRDFKTSFEIREEIRNRKQRLGESFDSFFEAVTSIHDRLPTPISELELVETLTRNLRPEIRQELLYIPINSLAHLRKLVHMRENFLNDDYVRKQLSNRIVNAYPVKRQIAEISDFSTESCEENIESVNAIQSFPQESRCWNCDENDHFWENCLSERKVFCYGCGAKDTYKPNCPTCANARPKFHKNFRQGNSMKKNT